MIATSKRSDEDRCTIRIKHVDSVKVVEVEYVEPIDQIALEFNRTRSTQLRKAYVREAVRLNKMYGRIYKETI